MHTGTCDNSIAHCQPFLHSLDVIQLPLLTTHLKEHWRKKNHKYQTKKH
jgi:hypothetical protein